MTRKLRHGIAARSALASLATHARGALALLVAVGCLSLLYGSVAHDHDRDLTVRPAATSTLEAPAGTSTAAVLGADASCVLCRLLSNCAVLLGAALILVIHANRSRSAAATRAELPAPRGLHARGRAPPFPSLA